MRTLTVVMSCLAIGGMSLSALAQDEAPRGGGRRPDQAGQPERGPGGPRGGGMGFGQQLSPEKAKSAWELQAKGVARSLGLNADQTAAIAKAYAAARESHNAALQKLVEEARDRAREEGGDDAAPGRGGARRGFGEMQDAMNELNTKERAKFEKALGATLNTDQTKKAMATLGTFNRQWDTMTDAVAGFNLESSKLAAAQQAMEKFVAQVGGLTMSDDPQGMMEARREARQKLNDAMKGVLTEEQFERFQAAGGMRGGTGGQGGRGEGGRGGSGGGGGGEGRPPRRGGGGGGSGGGGGGR